MPKTLELCYLHKYLEAVKIKELEVDKPLAPVKLFLTLDRILCRFPT